MKNNWLTYEFGIWKPIEGTDKEVWLSIGIANIDPSAVEAVMEVSAVAGYCAIGLSSRAEFFVRRSREEVIADIQSALS